MGTFNDEARASALSLIERLHLDKVDEGFDESDFYRDLDEQDVGEEEL